MIRIFVGVFLTLLLMAAASAETSDEKASCMRDAFRLCWNVIPDRHRVFLCLRQNRTQLSAGCRAALKASRAESAHQNQDDRQER
jgi:hypothetical protein